MRKVHKFLSSVALVVAIPMAAQIQVTVQGNQGPWSQSGNPQYGLGNNAAPMVISAASGIPFVAGGTITISYVSGQVYPGACGPTCVYADANGDTGWVANNSSTGAGNYPSDYMTAYPIYLVELVGTFAYNGIICGQAASGCSGEPFAIGDGPATFTVPAGANQLLLGANDNEYADNLGSWTVSISSTARAVPLRPNGVQNTITFTGLNLTPPICPVPLASNCFSIQQNFYMAAATNPAVPTYWVQNVLLASLGTLGGEWFVYHAYNIWSTNPNGGTIQCVAGCQQPLVLGTKWTPVSGIASSPPLNLAVTMSASGSSSTMRLNATIEAISGAIDLQRFSYDFPASSIIMAATTTEEAEQLAFTGYELEPELMVVGPELSESVAFNSATAGTLVSQFRYAGNTWLPPGTQYATQSVTNSALTGTTQPCSSTGEQSTGLYWPSGNIPSTAAFGGTTGGGDVQTEGTIFIPASGGLFLAACQP